MKFALLELLRERPMYGYEMIKALEEKSGGFYSPSPGSIYPTLQMLEERGLVTAGEAEGKKVYTITDPDAPYLTGTLVVVNTQFIAYPDDTGRFEITDVPAGSYKLKIWYRDGWLERPADTVEIGAKGKTELNPKVASLAPGKK